VRHPPSIDGYGAGGFRVSGVWRPGSLLILDDTPRDWRPCALDELEVADFDPVVEGGVGLCEFVLLGAGTAARPAPREVREALKAAGLGLEVMASDAAARMHNVLASQGRRFATALIVI